MKNIYLLGSTGSIGLQTLDVIRNNSNDFHLKAISIGNNIEVGLKIIEEFKPEFICFKNENDLSFDYNPTIVFSDSGLVKLATHNNSDKDALLVNALVGYVGLLPTYEAIKIKRNIALANKETLVMAGDIIMSMAKEYNVSIYPIDSEHSAIWQCLNGENIKEVKRLIITASGGSFRDLTKEQLHNVTLKDALNHPNWSMGSKITIDSATMMNKGFEVIEAHHLFNLDYNKIDTILHRQSIVHSLVEYNDLSVKAVLGTPDMRIPIMYALSYPKHIDYNASSLNLINSTLTFEELSHERFKCLEMAYIAGKKGGVYPTVLNASNEASVNLFLQGKIKFLDIEKIIESELSVTYEQKDYSIYEIIEIDREIQKRLLSLYGGKI